MLAARRSGAHILAAAEAILAHPDGLPRLYRTPHAPRTTHAANGGGKGHVEVISVDSCGHEAQ